MSSTAVAVRGTTAAPFTVEQMGAEAREGVAEVEPPPPGTAAPAGGTAFAKNSYSLIVASHRLVHAHLWNF